MLSLYPPFAWCVVLIYDTVPNVRCAHISKAKTYAEAQWWITILKAGAVGGPDGLPPPAHFYDHTEKKAAGDAAGADAAAAAEGGAAAETKEATAAAE